MGHSIFSERNKFPKSRGCFFSTVNDKMERDSHRANAGILCFDLSLGICELQTNYFSLSLWHIVFKLLLIAVNPPSPGSEDQVSEHVQDVQRHFWNATGMQTISDTVLNYAILSRARGKKGACWWHFGMLWLLCFVFVPPKSLIFQRRN